MVKARALKPYLFLLPILVLSAVFVYLPLGRSVIYSLSQVNRLGEVRGFVGPDNFMKLFGRREFLSALGNTLRMTAVNVPVTMVLTLFLGKLCAMPHPAAPFTEVLISLPMAVSMSAAALIFKVFLDPTVGYVNAALGLAFQGYVGAQTALGSIVMLTVWMGIGYNFLLFTGAFRGVPRDVKESAEMDGAGKLRIFFVMELPMIRPTAMYVLCTNTILAVMTSGPIMIITQGGPARSTTTLVYLMYTMGIGSGNFAMASCISLVLIALTLVFSLGTLYLDREKVQYA